MEGSGVNEMCKLAQAVRRRAGSSRFGQSERSIASAALRDKGTRSSEMPRRKSFADVLPWSKAKMLGL